MTDKLIEECIEKSKEIDQEGLMIGIGTLKIIIQKHLTESSEKMMEIKKEEELILKCRIVASCPNCKRNISSSDNYCPGCGKEIAWIE